MRDRVLPGRIAIGYGDQKRVEVWSATGPMITPDVSGGNEGDMASVVWSADGRFLFAGGMWCVNGSRHIRRWADGGDGLHTDLPIEADDTVMDPKPFGRSGLVFGCADPAFGVLDDTGRPIVTRADRRASRRGLGGRIRPETRRPIVAAETVGVLPFPGDHSRRRSFRFENGMVSASVRRDGKPTLGTPGSRHCLGRRRHRRRAENRRRARRRHAALVSPVRRGGASRPVRSSRRSALGGVDAGGTLRRLPRRGGLDRFPRRPRPGSSRPFPKPTFPGRGDRQTRSGCGKPRATS